MSTASRTTVICLSILTIVGLLVIFAPVIAAILFVLLVLIGAIAIGRKEGAWQGFLAFAKKMIFGW